MNTSILGRIYPDTNVLRESRWPDVSTQLKNLFVLCSFLKIQVCLPEPVEAEIEQHWIREFRGIVDKAKSRSSKLPTAFERGITIQSRSEDDLVAEFRASVQKNMKTYNIERVPYSSHSLRELFDRAIRHVPPFRDKGSGFQDAVILHSAVEHNSHTNDSKEAVLVTEDGPFAKAISISKDLGRLSVIHLAELISQLGKASPLAGEKAIKLWEAEIQSATKAVEGMKPELEKFVTTEYGNSIWFILMYREVQLVKMNRIFDVAVPIPGSEDAGRTRNVSFSFKTEIDIQTGSPTTSSSQIIGSIDFPAFTLTLERKIVEIEAVATIENGEYTGIRFISLRELTGN